jgi:hypothetical protein
MKAIKSYPEEEKKLRIEIAILGGAAKLNQSLTKTRPGPDQGPTMDRGWEALAYLAAS